MSPAETIRRASVTGCLFEDVCELKQSPFVERTTGQLNAE